MRGDERIRTAVPAPSDDPVYGHLDALLKAAQAVVERGHYDTCALELGLSAAYPCSCGIDRLGLALLPYASEAYRAALAAREVPS